MHLAPLPPFSAMRWRRLDVTGREAARFESLVDGWLLSGRLEVEEPGAIGALEYRIRCDLRWWTRHAAIDGVVNGDSVRYVLRSDGEGHWFRDEASIPHVSGAADIDLGFTPATNTLAIRRLELAVGESARVRSAWLRYPELRLEALDQTYTREAERVFRYDADVDGDRFTARLDIDRFGRVLLYEGLWEAEPDAWGLEDAGVRHR